jgi:hypothetical protein
MYKSFLDKWLKWNVMKFDISRGETESVKRQNLNFILSDFVYEYQIIR